MSRLVGAWLAAAAGVAYGAGLDTCQCIDIFQVPKLRDGMSKYRDGDKILYTPPGSLTTHKMNLSWGSGRSCLARDDGKAPYCDGDAPPSWCTASWCWVDPEACTGATKAKSSYFPDVDGLFYSYSTCASNGNSNSVNEWSEQDIQASRNMIELLENYSRTIRWKVEHAVMSYNSSASCDVDSLSMCECSNCQEVSRWNDSVYFFDAGVLQTKSNVSAEDKHLGACLSSGIAGEYMRTAAKEADEDFSRVGYQYAGDQQSGTLTMWPKVDMCTEYGDNYDPRLRPWYASAATGPKDVVILVDVSGSMRLSNRFRLAKNATKAILDTLTWKDFATIILFNSRASAVYGDGKVLHSMTDSTKASMMSWCDEQYWAGGGTSFRQPLDKAFEILQNSTDMGVTSMCQRAIMFLTDGKDNDWSNDDFTHVQQEAKKHNATFFTYALGSSADAKTVKRLACDNKGVFYPVADGANLSDIMTSYYEFFAHGQEICSSSFVKYTDIGSNHTLYASCMAMYDRTHPTPDLLGVTCTDVNMLHDIDEWKSKPGWEHFMCTASDMTKMCRSVQLTECHRQRIRLAYSQDSVCTDSEVQVTDSTVCPCVEGDCVDDNNYRDEKNYFCDTWVGDDCNNPNPAWNYSEEGMADIRKKCKKSCGLCQWSEGACPRSDALECPVIPVETECRACLGVTTGLDLDGKAMKCPEDAPRNMVTTTLEVVSGTTVVSAVSLGSVMTCFLSFGYLAVA